MQFREFCFSGGLSEGDIVVTASSADTRMTASRLALSPYALEHLDDDVVVYQLLVYYLQYRALKGSYSGVGQNLGTPPHRSI